MIPGVQDMADDLVQADAVLDLRKNEGAGAAHEFGVPFHDLQVGADSWG